jgi:threonine synthase
VAGVRQMVRNGTIQPGESVVSILTGHVLKDPQTVIDFHLGGDRHANPPVEIEPSVQAVARLLRRRV